jgi:rhodanese-related sulfurtransferase
MEIPTAVIGGVPDPIPDGVVVLDVREDDEWAAGHVAGSVHVPLMELGERRGEIPEAEQTLVVCRSGNRSAHATAYLRQQGIEAVNLAGGLVAWQAAGRPLVTDGDEPGHVR